MGIGFGFKQVPEIEVVKESYEVAMEAIKKAFHS